MAGCTGTVALQLFERRRAIKMGNCDKFTRGSALNLTRHYERFINELGEYIKFKNQDIDPSRTHLNYNLGPPRDLSQWAFIKKRTTELECRTRSNINVMVSWVVTVPQDLPEEHHKLFFEETYKFLTARYGGEENVISAYVHMDESSPHIHYAFVPVVWDKGKEKYKVSAKETTTKKDWLTFHPDIEAYMETVFGYKIGLNTGITAEQGGNRSIASLKTKSLKKAREVVKHLVDGLADGVEALNELRDRVCDKLTDDEAVLLDAIIADEAARIAEVGYIDLAAQASNQSAISDRIADQIEAIQSIDYEQGDER
jgi:hypothetical protein